LSEHTLYTTGATGALLEKELDLPIYKFQSGPWGRDHSRLELESPLEK